MRGWPQIEEAKRLGCTCIWYGPHHIGEFSSDCPILRRHNGAPCRNALRRREGVGK